MRSGVACAFAVMLVCQTLAEVEDTDNAIEAATPKVGKPILVEDKFCDISFMDKVPADGNIAVRKVKDANGFESFPRVRLKKPFRKFIEATLTYTSGGTLSNVSLIYVFPKVRAQKDVEAAAKEFNEIVRVIGAKYEMNAANGLYVHPALTLRDGKRETIACREFNSVAPIYTPSLYRIQVALDVWTRSRARASLKGTLPPQVRNENYLVLVVSVDNKRVEAMEGADAL